MIFFSYYILHKKYFFFKIQNLNKFFHGKNPIKNGFFLYPTPLFKKKINFTCNFFYKQAYAKYFNLTKQSSVSIDFNYNPLFNFKLGFYKSYSKNNFICVSYKIKINTLNNFKCFFFYLNKNIFVFYPVLKHHKRDLNMHKLIFLIFFSYKSYLIYKVDKLSFYKNNSNLINPKNFEFFYSFNYLFFGNNFYPHINDNILKSFSILLNEKKKIRLFVFNIINLKFLEQFFKNKFFIKIKTNFFKKLIVGRAIQTILFKLNSKNLFYLKNFNMRRFVSLLVYSLYKKDLFFLFNWFILILGKVPIGHHKQFLTFFKNSILNEVFIFFPYFNIKGFFFDIRGKVGVAGNSKKRHFFFKAGSLGFSNKKTKLEYKHDIVKTVTGCLGVTMFLAYY